MDNDDRVKTEREVFEDAQTKRAKAILSLIGSDADALYSWAIDYCRLMGKQNFTLERCTSYTRSGSPTCMTCNFRQQLRVVSKSLEGNNMSESGICTHCGLERIIIAKGKCFRCNYGNWKDISSEELRKRIAEGEFVIRNKDMILSPPISPIPNIPNNKYVDTSEPSKSKPKVTKNSEMFIDTGDPIFKDVLKLAAEERRSFSDQVIYILEKRIKDDKEPSIKQEVLNRILDRCKSYPVPAGTSSEVFIATIELIKVRISEESNDQY